MTPRPIKNFNQIFFDSITEDEKMLLLAIFSVNSTVRFELQFANPQKLLNKLVSINNLTEEGNQLRNSILHKFQESTCIYENNS